MLHTIVYILIFLLLRKVDGVTKQMSGVQRINMRYELEIVNKGFKKAKKRDKMIETNQQRLEE
jgi:hypothetical protein